MTLVVRAAMTEHPIYLSEHEELVGHRSAGAIVGFVGMIRDHDAGRRVVRLEYSAHPSAAQVLTDAVAEVANGSDGVRGLFYGDPSQFFAQVLSAVVVTTFAFSMGYCWFKFSNLVTPIRVTAEVEVAGLDIPETGIQAYPEAATL